ncbi:putative leucine-rich repeat-containing protein DDB_G0290503 [Macrobrachium rosenbergii]|uniref:putative leucine-rich repeat-containing protein DDB_G0290503 n=1 Tax=Macrobrachium rosenbergii TaxID=79674 RepID=UPI0034D6D12A
MDVDADSTSDNEASRSAYPSDSVLASQSDVLNDSHQDMSTSKSHRSGGKHGSKAHVLESPYYEDNGKNYEYSDSKARVQKSAGGTFANEESNDSINETSLDETSFTSVGSDSKNQSSSELSVDPVVWKKFKFLSSILKETQHNLRAMDDLILEHRRIQDITNLQMAQNRASGSCSHLSLSDNQKLGEGEPKTDEAKLEEILGLLHNLTATLSSYEQHPLLASATQASEVATSYAPASQQFHQFLSVPSNNDPTGQKQSPQQQSSHEKYNPQLSDSQQQLSQHSLSSLTRSQQSFCQPIESPLPVSEHLSLDRFSSRPEILPTERGLRYFEVNNVVSDTLLSPRMSQDSLKSNLNTLRAEEGTRNIFFHAMPQCSASSERPPQHHQEPFTHPLTKETRSLRKDIDDIVIRKQALDSRLQSLIAHRASQKEAECEQSAAKSIKSNHVSKSQSIDEVSEKRKKYHMKKYKGRSKSQDDPSLQSSGAGTSIRDTYLSMISEDKDEFPSLVMGSFENEEKITELRKDEADLPGLGDSGLSSEINSINATIQELIRENQRLHTFLQGITCESIAKVDQQKLELEAQIQSLNEENHSLKMAMSGGSIDKEESKAAENEEALTSKQENKSVTFLLEDKGKKANELEDKQNSFDKHSHGNFDEIESLLQESDSISAQPGTSTKNALFIEMAEQQELSDKIKTLEDKVDLLTKQNNDLLMKSHPKIDVKKDNLDKEEQMYKLQSELRIDDMSDVSSSEKSNKEVEILKGKVKKLIEEKNRLEFKLNDEITSRDMECSRLEARIRILSGQNQSLTSKFLKNETDLQLFKAKEKFSLNSGSFVENVPVERDIDNDSAIGEVVIAPDYTESILIKPTRVQDKPKVAVVEGEMEDTRMLNEIKSEELTQIIAHVEKVKSKAEFDLLPPHGTETFANKFADRNDTLGTAIDNLGGGTHDHSPLEETKGVMLHPNKTEASSENVRTLDIADLGKSIMPEFEFSKNTAVLGTEGRYVTYSSHQSIASNDHPKSLEGSVNDVNMNALGSGIGIRNEDSKLTEQLSLLMQQSGRLMEGLNEIRNSTKISEMSFETTLTHMFSEHRQIIEDIKQKLENAKSSDKKEFEEEIGKLSKEKQELVTDLEKKQNQIESLINQNSSLEKKLHFTRKSTGTKVEADEKTSDLSLTGEDEDNESTKVKDFQQSSKANGNRQATDFSSGNGSHSIDGAQSSEEVNLRRHSSGHDICSSKGGDSSGNGGSTPRRQDLLLYKKEKQNWARLLEQSEAEKQVLRERISTLVNENDCLAARLEEVMGVSRNLSDQVHSTKEQLLKVSAEKEDLQKKFKLLEEGKEDSSLSLSDSGASTRLTQRLRERIRTLQGEVEGAWQEVHVRTMEKDKIQAEKESLEYTSGIAVATVKKEVEALKCQILSLEREMEKKQVDLANAKNELEKKSGELRSTEEEVVSHQAKLREAEHRIVELENFNTTCKEDLKKLSQAKKSIEAKLEESSPKKVSSSHHSALHKSDQGTPRSERHWTEIVTYLKSQLHEEQLRSRLLEAAERESSARILVLQHSVRDTIEAHENLQAKYKQLRAAYRAKKKDKSAQKEFTQQYSSQIKELYNTSNALEENYKLMLSALGENIEIAVGILTSHVFLSPCMIHPTSDLRKNPESWFGSQLGKLRWLQTQLRKLCLHTWKTANLPRTSNLGFTALDDSNESENFPQDKSSKVTLQEASKEGIKLSSSSSNSPIKYMKKSCLSELSILDESQSYPSTPVKKLSMSGMVGCSSGSSLNSCSSPKAGSPIIIHMSEGNLRDPGTFRVSDKVAQGNLQSTSVFSNSSMTVSEARNILTLQQQQLSEAKYRQYKALVSSLQKDLECSTVFSPSVPSSVTTTPEDADLPLRDSGKGLHVESFDSSSENGEVESHSSSKTLVSASSSGQSSETNGLSQDLSGSQKSCQSGKPVSSSTPQPIALPRELLKEDEESLSVIQANNMNRKAKGNNKTESKNGVDSDKDHDSWEAGNEDIIKTFVDKEEDEGFDFD